MVLTFLVHALLEDPENPPELQMGEVWKESIPVRSATLFFHNQSLLPPDVLFASTNAYLRILKDGAIKIGGITLRLSDTPPRFITAENREGRFAYFGPRKRVSGIPTYRSVRFKEIHKGVDFVLNGVENGKLEYYFYVKPGGDVGRIALRVEGGDVEVWDDGVRVEVGGKEVLRIEKPRAFQGSKEIGVSFTDLGDNTFGFKLAGYDPSLPLVIDPTVILAGPSYEKLTDVEIDDYGNVYAVGFTTDYINFAGGYDRLFGTAIFDSMSVFVSKLSPNLTTLIANVIISGSHRDYGWQILLGGDGTLYVGVSTNSPDYAPLRTVFGTYSGWDFNTAITRLDTSLMTHISTVVITGSDHDILRAMAMASDGSIYITGYTYNSSNFAPARVIHGSPGLIDVFVTRLSHDLSTHMATAIIGGSSNDVAYGITTYGSGVYILGATSSSDFAPFRTVWGISGGWDAYVSKLSLDLNTHMATVIIAGVADDATFKGEIDPSGNLIAAGLTYDPTNLSLSRTIWGTPGSKDVFLTRTSSDLLTHIATTVIASPDSVNVKYRSFTLRGDTGFVFMSVTDPASWGGGECAACDYASGGGPRDNLVIGITSDLSTCIGKSVITGAGSEDVYSIKVRGSDIYTAGFLIGFDTTTLSTYPQPSAIYGYPWDVDGLVIKARPQCLVGVEEYNPETAEEDVFITGEGITVRLSVPAYVGYDVYTPDGRRVKAVSVGYLLPGTYNLPLHLRRGVYLLRLRVGDRVFMRSVVR